MYGFLYNTNKALHKTCIYRKPDYEGLKTPSRYSKGKLSPQNLPYTKIQAHIQGLILHPQATPNAPHRWRPILTSTPE